jgi:hypothetical protein
MRVVITEKHLFDLTHDGQVKIVMDTGLVINLLHADRVDTDGHDSNK